jgi:DNA-binding response OmpR family regulator
MSNGSPGALGRIMVVDDDVVTARFMTHVLGKRGGFEVRHAPDAVSALAMARSQPWDLVITDVEMPGMSGLELLRALREIAPDLPVAVITGHASVDYVVEAIRSDADEFLEKPVHPGDLITAATVLVNRGRERRHTARDSVLAVGAHPDDVEYCFQSPSATVDFRPGRFVAIASDLDRKIVAIGAFTARTPARGYLDEDMIRATARYWSRFGDSSYAEAFEVIREPGGLPMRPHAAVTGQAAAPA